MPLKPPGPTQPRPPRAGIIWSIRSGSGRRWRCTARSCGRRRPPKSRSRRIRIPPRMATDLARSIAEAYRWQRRLGNTLIAAPHCHIVADPAHPQVWDSNHADEVTARTDAEIDAVFAAMDRHLGHTPWRVIHTDGFTPDVFLARLALDDFEERPVTIQMALQGGLRERGAPIDLRPVADDADWDALLQLVV